MKTPTQKGFTLLELVTTLSIVAIFALVALPNMTEFIKNERLTTQINSLVASLQRARSEAVTRHVPVVLCSSNNGSGCTGSAWQNGWILFVDPNNSGTLDAGEQILLVNNPLDGNTRLINSSNTYVISYDSRGFTPNLASTFSLCDTRGASHGKAISITNTGRVSVGGTVSC